MQSTDGQKVGVSVVIPVWGTYKKFLHECLESVYSQTYNDYEVIVVDDCTDLPTARNKGIKASNSEYLMILDVDNKLYPEYLKRTIDQGDIVTTYFQYFGDSNSTFKPSNPTLELFKIGNQIDANALIKRSVFDKVGLYDENMKDGWEDYEFWIRCLKNGFNITIIPELLLLYRKHGETMSVTAGKKAGELMKYIFDRNMI